MRRKPQFALSILKRDGIVWTINPWEWPDNVAAPYFEFAVTVIDQREFNRHLRSAQSKTINWYGMEANGYRDYL